jgi:hypothetical protein
MKIFEVTQPQNVTEPEEPVDQQPEVQAEPEQTAPAEPQRKPRYAWQAWDKNTEYSNYVKAQQLAQAQHAGVSPDDFDMTIDDFPNPYFRADGPEDEEDPNFEYDTVSVGVDYEYSYHGKYYAATQIDPAEYPELEISINRVIDLSNGEDITKKVDLSEIEQYIEDEIPSWEDEEREARDQAAIDRYEANRDDYYESIDRIKNLSGLK